MNLNKKIRWLTTASLISTVSFTGRIAFQSIPNVQPLTTIVIICILANGFSFGATVSLLSLLLSNMLLGMGLWTFPQITGYMSICLITFCLSSFLEKSHLFVKSFFAGLMGFLYGFIISIIQSPFLGIQNFLAYYLQGLPFDLFHAVSNFGFMLILYPILMPLLKKQDI